MFNVCLRSLLWRLFMCLVLTGVFCELLKGIEFADDDEVHLLQLKTLRLSYCAPQVCIL